MHRETDERRKQKNLGDWQLISEGKGRERQALREEKQQLLPCMGLELIRLGHLSGGGARGELLLGLWAVRVVQEMDWVAGGRHTDQMRARESELASSVLSEQ